MVLPGLVSVSAQGVVGRHRIGRCRPFLFVWPEAISIETIWLDEMRVVGLSSWCHLLAIWKKGTGEAPT